MTTGSPYHISLFLFTVAFMALSTLGVSRLPRKWQDAAFVVAAVLGSGGVFFRYAMNCSFTDGLQLDTLLIQLLQVCNFNFVLLPLMLIPKCEIARQYSVFFSMFAACTTMFSIPSSLSGYEWHHPIVLNFWFNHVFAIALPIWMIAAKRLRPDRKYIPLVSGCVFGYFTLVYLLTEALMALGVLAPGSSFSYVHDPKGMPLLTQLYELIGLPYVHLLPIFPILIGFFYLWSMPYTRSVSFETASGSGRVGKRYGVIGGEVKLPYGGFIREGYVLIGWSDVPGGETVVYAPGASFGVSERNSVLYAVWRKLEQEPAEPVEELDEKPVIESTETAEQNDTNNQ